MRTGLVFIFIIVLGITSWSCKGSKKVTEAENNGNDAVVKVLLYNKPLDSLKTDYFNIDSISLKDQTLLVYVTYSGGCGDATFEMYYVPQLMNVMPHRSNMALKLTDNDPCREIVSKKLAYDVSVFNKEAQTGGIVLTLGKYEFMYTISEQ